MTDQSEIEARKAASAAGATDNHGVGVNGDESSVADAAAEDDDESASADHA